jgi:hypothetical protein
MLGLSREKRKENILKKSILSLERPEGGREDKIEDLKRIYPKIRLLFPEPGAYLA